MEFLGTMRDYLRRSDFIADVTKKIVGRKPILSLQVEKDLVTRLFRLGSTGYPLTGKARRRNVYIFCEKFSIQNPFQNKAAGRLWLQGFLKQNPEVAKRIAQHLNEARARTMNRPIVDDYFLVLKNI